MAGGYAVCGANSNERKTKMAKKSKVNGELDHMVVTLEIEDPDGKERDRLVSLDLDDEDDWGDLETGVDEDGKAWAMVGSGERCCWRVARAFVVIPLSEKHDGKFPMARALTLRELDALVRERFEKYEG